MIGTTISHYEITEKLGEGGMGVIYKAQDTSLDRPVALKFLAAHLVADEDVRKRFEREAKAAAALNHPNICTVHEIAEDNGRTFIAMAFLEGEALDKKIEAGPLTLKDALAIGTQTAQGLQAAHEKGIVHRDIKPANLMVAGAGSRQLVTIMDFGLAQLADRSKLTRLDETMGTVTYMSPEQTYSSEIDRRSDIWSLGVVLYEMVTGQQPFKGHYDQAVMYSITSEEPEPMTALRTGVPMELELLVNKCLAKDADRRYQSTADMVVDLESLSEKLKSGKSTILRTSAPVGAGTPAGPSDAGAGVVPRVSQSLPARHRQDRKCHQRRQAHAPPHKGVLVGLWRRSVLSGCWRSRSSISARPLLRLPCADSPLRRRKVSTLPLTVSMSLSHPTAKLSPLSPRDRRESCGSRISISGNRGRSTVPKELGDRSGRPTVVSSGLQPVGNSRRSRFRAAWPFGSASCPAQLFLEEPGARTAR